MIALFSTAVDGLVMVGESLSERETLLFLGG